jgi:hypothetical protein
MTLAPGSICLTMIDPPVDTTTTVAKLPEVSTHTHTQPAYTDIFLLLGERVSQRGS